MLRLVSSPPQWLIAGLGNPGREYHQTRHNAGFLALDELIESYHFGPPSVGRKFRGMLGRGEIEDIPVFLLKPTTYMNLSGEAIRAVTDYYHIEINSHLIVISDEIHLPAGRIRIRKKGSAGGHNGLKSIITQLGTEDFIRIRIGVGDASGDELVGHVLGRPAPEDREDFEQGIRLAARAAAAILKDGPDSAMNQFNALPPKENT